MLNIIILSELCNCGRFNLAGKNFEKQHILAIFLIVMDLIAAMLDPGVYPDAADQIEFIQTHISYIFLTKNHAYKIKKPVNFGFLDFSTLRKRHHFLEQELVLNRRLAPEIYLAVLPLVLREGKLHLGGEGKVIEYALQMVRLPQHLMMDEIADRRELTTAMLDAIVARLVPFYGQAATGARVNKFGELAVIRYNHEENFSQIQPFKGSALSAKAFHDIVKYANGFMQRQANLFGERIKAGKIRDCHGDLHMRNICLTDGVYIFDCLEFNPRFRYSDVAADIDFLAMDLDFHAYDNLSNYFVNTFAAASADPDILKLVNFYKCYRAVVRGKIQAFAAEEPELPHKDKQLALNLARDYFNLAWRYSQGG
jgi:aminoglycoside phosphotransferase family enzyme